MKESDWKKFKTIKQKALERFCARVLAESETVISNTDEHVHSRYLQLYSLIQSRNKEMAQLFDYHSRSMASLQLTMIRAHGLVEESWLEVLSDEFRDVTDPKWLGKGQDPE